MAYCGSCGAQLQQGDAFCRACGHPVADARAAGAQPATRERNVGQIAIVSAVVILLLAAGIMLFLTQCRSGVGVAGSGSTSTTQTASSVATPSATTGGTSATATASATTGSATSGSATTKPSTTTSSLTANDVTHQPTFVVKSGSKDGKTTLTFDYVLWLTGAAADKAAKAHGDTVENDYYVVNDNTKLRTFPVSDSAVIVLHPGGDPTTSRTFTADEFVSLMGSNTATYGGVEYFWSKETVYYVTIKNGVVTKLEHQWVP